MVDTTIYSSGDLTPSRRLQQVFVAAQLPVEWRKLVADARYLDVGGIAALGSDLTTVKQMFEIIFAAKLSDATSAGAERVRELAMLGATWTKCVALGSIQETQRALGG